MTKKEFDLIKEVINERIKLDDIGPAVRLVTLYNRHELINDRVMERLYNCLKMVFMLLVICMMSLKVWKMKRKLIDARPAYYYISVYTYSCFLL